MSTVAPNAPAVDDRVARPVEPVDVAHAVPERHPLRWVATVVVAVLAAQLIHMLVTNPNFEWDVVFQYFNTESVGRGLLTTLKLTVIAMAVGIVLGVLLAVCRLSSNWLVRLLAAVYIWFFRGVPALVQLIFWFNLSALMPRVSIGIPFGPEFMQWETNALITPLLAAILGLGLNEGAYMAEIVRGGLMSVDQGQTEAAQALGMSRTRTLFRVVLPQAMRFIVPPTGSQVINMLKATSLVSVIALSDLLYTVQAIYNRTFQTIPLLLVACIWYLVITSILYVGQSFIERHYARGSNRNTPTRFRDVLKIRRKPVLPTVEVPS